MNRIITRWFNIDCPKCHSKQIIGPYERQTGIRRGDLRCPLCNAVYEPPVLAYLYHPESDSAFSVTDKKDLERCLNEGCQEVSEYFCTMVEMGLYDEIDFEYEKQQMMRGGTKWAP